eukprot:CAMPEP_0119485930 /NCGR_PEP_ID=MMETSP1344-20130328/12482_1 /TAXON_ID=236787 /ORGANISM="Florenciella parvula, Strain CCMP2471" /LENGTH=34 /DNA_ID= /DNA_START= /DNA_END= /DNA_ORIENTATION=
MATLNSSPGMTSRARALCAWSQFSTVSSRPASRR